MITVTVVIPCHNCEKWVGRAINSVLVQTYPVEQILLIENNSTDGTKLLLQQFESDHPNIIKVYSEPKKGACAARNLGIEKATGSWIQFLDADDEILPNKIEDQINIIKDQNPDVIVGDYVRVVQNKNSFYQVHIATENDPWLGLIRSKLGITSANLWKKKSLIQINKFDENVSSSQEYDLMFRLLQTNHKFVSFHRMHTIIYKQPESISKTRNSSKNSLVFQNRYDLRLRIFSYLEEKGLLSSRYKQEILKSLWYLLLLMYNQNKLFFRQQISYVHFSDLKFINKLKAYKEYVNHYTRMMYSDSRLPVKLLDFTILITHAHLLKY